MNLSTIERMVMNGEMSVESLRYLINCKGECEWLDYKEYFSIDNDKALCDFTKDVIAMKNVGGGYILIGVTDKTWLANGIPAMLPYDSKMLRDKVLKSSSLSLEVDIVHHNIYLNGKDRLFALIHIRSSKKRKKRRVPSIVKKDFCTNEKYGIRKGDIYFRSGDSTIRLSSESELVELLDNLELQADSDSIVNVSSPFAVEDGLFRLLERGFDSFIGRTVVRKDIINSILKDPRIWIINVHGPGGVGKSALVNWVVYEFYETKEFEAIIHLTAKDTILTEKGIEKFSRSLYSLENLLDHILLLFEESSTGKLEDKKALVTEFLSAWNTLIVLDNMETVQDGRILHFVQNLPPGTKAKVLITSRHKTGGWELPFPIKELSEFEVEEFLIQRTKELNINLKTDRELVNKIINITGGLPLAIQWVLGNYKICGNIDEVFNAAKSIDAPILEFSFRSIWQRLSNNARQILAIISIFDEPPTIQQLSIATNYQIESIESALNELLECTLLNKNTQFSDGKVTFIALPITLTFSRFQLGEMGDFEINCRQRLRRFDDQISLNTYEVNKYNNRFEKFGISSENEKKAAILCFKGESEMFIGKADSAEMLFKQARELDPNSAYVWTMNASYELARNRIGNALSFIEQAIKRANKKNGALCFSVKARIHYAQKDNLSMLYALEKVLDYDGEDLIARHQYGVALSKVGYSEKAIKEFDFIIDKEIQKEAPSETLLMAIKTRMINLRRLKRYQEFDADKKLVTKIFKDYPYLATESYKFSDILI